MKTITIAAAMLAHATTATAGDMTSPGLSFGVQASNGKAIIEAPLNEQPAALYGAHIRYTFDTQPEPLWVAVEGVLSMGDAAFTGTDQINKVLDLNGVLGWEVDNGITPHLFGGITLIDSDKHASEGYTYGIGVAWKNVAVRYTYREYDGHFGGDARLPEISVMASFGF